MFFSKCKTLLLFVVYLSCAAFSGAQESVEEFATDIVSPASEWKEIVACSSKDVIDAGYYVQIAFNQKTDSYKATVSSISFMGTTPLFSDEIKFKVAKSWGWFGQCVFSFKHKNKKAPHQFKLGMVYRSDNILEMNDNGQPISESFKRMRCWIDESLAPRAEHCK